MFRNVTGAQEAVVHRQSEDSLSHGNNQIKSIKDIQSDDIAQTYSILKSKWFHEREQLIENLKNLEKHKAFPEEIQHVKNLIECLNDLIDNGELTKNCQTLINQMNTNIQPIPETYMLTKKPLGDKTIRLPRHVSKTIINVSSASKRVPSEITSIQGSEEKLQHQIEPQGHVQQKQMDENSDNDTSASTEKMKTGIQFYVVAEQFRNRTDHSQDNHKKSRRKHYASSLME